MRLSIKDVRSQGGGGLSSADILWTRGVLQMRMSALFGENIGFFKIYGVFAQTRRVDLLKIKSLLKL